MKEIRHHWLVTIAGSLWIAAHIATYIIVGLWLGIGVEAYNGAFFWWLLGLPLLAPSAIAPIFIYLSATGQ